jgi:hypothetical protein
MEIAADKSETLLISLDPAQSQLEPQLTLCVEAILYINNPIFLGVMFDRGLTWKAHCDKISTAMSSRFKQLRVISGKSWGMALYVSR